MLKIKLLFALLFLTLGFSTAAAQNTDNVNNQQFDEPERPQLMRELGLRPEQIRQIKMINGENRDKMREANFRLHEARKNLDAAIYSDNANDASVETALREFQNAQTQVIKIRTMTEFAIRKILSPEQLVRFRELRARFEQFQRGRRGFRQELRQNPQNRGLGKGLKPPPQQD
jgi:Spy/CpxP family protein refolding chaperone